VLHRRPEEGAAVLFADPEPFPDQVHAAGGPLAGLASLVLPA
jgi:hypothetical protein